MFASRNRYLIAFLVLLNLIIVIGLLSLSVLFVLNTNSTNKKIDDLSKIVTSFATIKDKPTDNSSLDIELTQLDLWQSDVSNMNVTIDFTDLNEISYSSTKDEQSCYSDKSSETLTIKYPNSISVNFGINPCGLGFGPLKEISKKEVTSKTGEVFTINLMQSDFEEDIIVENRNYYSVMASTKDAKDIFISVQGVDESSLDSANSMVDLLTKLIGNVYIN